MWSAHTSRRSSVTPLDPLSYGISAAAVLALSLAAAWLPARRATRVDPMESLRAE
jgi:putative ABC transport system permease protein